MEVYRITYTKHIHASTQIYKAICTCTLCTYAHDTYVRMFVYVHMRVCVYTCMQACTYVLAYICEPQESTHTFFSDSSIPSSLSCEVPFDCRLLEEADREGETSSLASAPVLVITKECTEGPRDRRFCKASGKHMSLSFILTSTATNSKLIFTRI